MAGNILYSTNVFLKYYIHKEFYNDFHYVWCCDMFDAKASARYTSSSLVAPTSNPYDIYFDLKNAIDKHDRHNKKITEQKDSIKAIAIKNHKNGIINDTQKDEIIFMVDYSDFRDWRPLIYLIPKDPVIQRLKTVPIKNRASFGTEYIIEDLNTSEFDVIEEL